MDLQEHRRLFIDEFCKRYLNQTGKEYNEKIDYILGHKICELCVRLEKERTNASEYLEWIFDYYVNDKYFKKYLPVTMDLLVKMWVINKYIYALVEAERASKKTAEVITKCDDKYVSWLEKYKNETCKAWELIKKYKDGVVNE